MLIFTPRNLTAALSGAAFSFAVMSDGVLQFAAGMVVGLACLVMLDA